MTTITIDRAVVEQALEALYEETAWFGPTPKGAVAITALRSALAQQAEPVEPPKPAPLKRGTTGRCTRKVCECEKEGLGPECIHLEPVIDGYPLWSGIPKAEPVYWEVRCTAHPKWMRVDEQQFDEYVAHGWEGQRLYTAPPRQAEPVQDQRCRAEPRSDGDFVCDCKIGECPGRSATLAQEPVAWRFKPMIGSPWSLSDDGYYISCKRDKGYIVEPLYAAPPQREPVLLTDEEIDALPWNGSPRQFARAVEKASWERNHGKA